eukprot:7183895-Ditylum_brightwellii.AAC.1
MEVNEVLLEEEQNSSWRSDDRSGNFLKNTAQQIEYMMTLLKRQHITRDNKRNVTIGYSLDIHWPDRGIGVSYNNNSSML